MDDFQMGIFYAAALLVTLHDQPSMAADVLEQAGLLNANLDQLDDTEKDAMAILQKQEKRCEFLGV